MNNRKYEYLMKRYIRMPGVKYLFEKWHGKRDARQNQLCPSGEDYTTPAIESKVSCFDSHVDGIYLRTALTEEPMISEAHALITELGIVTAPVKDGGGDNPEEVRRKMEIAAARRNANAERMKQILIRLSAIRAESDMVDQMLLHYIGRAEGILNSRISKYWRGVLVVSQENHKTFPDVQHKESPGRQAYENNRSKLLSMIGSAINENGGDAYAA